MNAIRLFAACALALSISRAAPPADGALAAEKAWSSAIVSGKADALASILADDLTYNHSSGDSDTKQSYMQRITSGSLKYVSVDYDADPVVRVYGSTAVVTASAHVASLTNGKDTGSHLRFLHVFVNSNGTWKLVAHQSCKLAN